MKVHIHDEQFDGHMHAWCGKEGKHPIVVTQRAFEATPPKHRCKICEHDWFPNDQPIGNWEFKAWEDE